MTSAQVVGASVTHNSLPEDYSHVEGHNNQILLRCWWWHLSAGVRGADGIGDWNCHISLSESHTVHWDEHGHGLRARRRQPGWRRADQRRADGRVWRRRKRREARDLVRWRWTYRCGGSQMRDVTGRVRIQVRGVTVVLFWRFCYRRVQNWQQATWRSHGRAGAVDGKQPILHSRRSVIAVSNRVGELSERVSEWVKEGWEGRTFTDVYLNEFCVWPTGDAAARSTQHQTSLVASRQRVPARAHVHGLLPCWWELWNMLRWFSLSIMHARMFLFPASIAVEPTLPAALPQGFTKGLPVRDATAGKRAHLGMAWQQIRWQHGLGRFR